MLTGPAVTVTVTGSVGQMEGVELFSDGVGLPEGNEEDTPVANGGV